MDQRVNVSIDTLQLYPNSEAHMVRFFYCINGMFAC